MVDSFASSCSVQNIKIWHYQLYTYFHKFTPPGSDAITVHNKNYKSLYVGSRAFYIHKTVMQITISPSLGLLSSPYFTHDASIMVTIMVNNCTKLVHPICQLSWNIMWLKIKVTHNVWTEQEALLLQRNRATRYVSWNIIAVFWLSYWQEALLIQRNHASTMSVEIV